MRQGWKNGSLRKKGEKRWFADLSIIWALDFPVCLGLSIVGSIALATGLFTKRPPGVKFTLALELAFSDGETRQTTHRSEKKAKRKTVASHGLDLACTSRRVLHMHTSTEIRLPWLPSLARKYRLFELPKPLVNAQPSHSYCTPTVEIK